jgi:hypothetical protein
MLPNSSANPLPNPVFGLEIPLLSGLQKYT